MINGTTDDLRKGPVKQMKLLKLKIVCELLYLLKRGMFDSMKSGPSVVDLQILHKLQQYSQ